MRAVSWRQRESKEKERENSRAPSPADALLCPREEAGALSGSGRESDVGSEEGKRDPASLAGRSSKEEQTDPLTD